MGASSTTTGGMGSGIRNLLRGAVGAADHTAWLRQLDEDFIKPTLLLDQGQGQGQGRSDSASGLGGLGGGGGGGVGGGSSSGPHPPP